ncbi:hypothetical protein [Nannocystis bainbridge]|uniref:Cell division protein FtsL n=1 Tax=Nannocystis bainbridge TaxID=2995303 RepID=A0ABT5DXF7_9BACT|nr:hypothetical protein [Nannocystis bainbridge]MDC0718302.1 hypothetical protein [Nannocystis bainbridge]
MSIYGPPASLARDHARRTGLQLTRVILAVIAITGLVGVAMVVLLESQDLGSHHLAVDRAETIRLEAEARHEVMRLQTAEFLPSVPIVPDLEAPPPLLRSAELLPVDAWPRPIDDDAHEPGEPERKSPAEPARLQTAEILH